MRGVKAKISETELIIDKSQWMNESEQMYKIYKIEKMHKSEQLDET